MRKVEIELRIKKDERQRWEDIQSTTLAVVPGQEDAAAVEAARWIDANSAYFIEARWNFVGSYQGHYVSRMKAGLE